MTLLALLMLAATADSLAGYPGPVQYAQAGTQRVAYYEAGAGDETVLLVHGLGTNMAVWKDVLPALARHYRVLAVDLPGFGLSSKDDVPATMPFFAHTLAALLDTLGIERAHYVGLSMGGQVGLVLALEAPERLRRVVLLSPAGIETFTEQEGALLTAAFTPEAVLHTPPERYAQNVALNFHRYDAGRDGWLLEQRRQLEARDDFAGYAAANARAVAGMLSHPVRDRLAALAVPTLVVFGTGDKLIPNPYLHPALTTEAVAAEADAASPQIQTALIADAGHLLPLEKPDEVAERTLAFLRAPQ